MPICIHSLTKHIGKQLVLDAVSLTIRDGEVIGLLGPNGAGKSTLMKIVAGVWQGDAPNAVSGSSGLRIGYLPEQDPLYEEMYVREYLRLFVGLRKAVPRREQKAYIEQLIARVGLQPEANKRIGALSKGYRQRVGLAQALIGEPQLLLLDEPTTGLDPNQLGDIRTLIREAGKDRMVILSTHILQEVMEMCNRVVILCRGQIGADIPIRDIAGVQALEELFYRVTTTEA